MTASHTPIEGGRERLRAQLAENFAIALGRDPVCGGRVSSATVDWLADEAMRACDATARAAIAKAKPHTSGEVG